MCLLQPSSVLPVIQVAMVLAAQDSRRPLACRGGADALDDTHTKTKQQSKAESGLMHTCYHDVFPVLLFSFLQMISSNPRGLCHVAWDRIERVLRESDLRSLLYHGLAGPSNIKQASEQKLTHETPTTVAPQPLSPY